MPTAAVNSSKNPGSVGRRGSRYATTAAAAQTLHRDTTHSNEGINISPGPKQRCSTLNQYMTSAALAYDPGQSGYGCSVRALDSSE